MRAVIIRAICFTGMICLAMAVAIPARPAAASSQLDGPGSVDGILEHDGRAKAATDLKGGLLDAYFRFKKEVAREYGFSFGLDYNALFQAASDSPGRDTAASGSLRLFGQWTLIGRGSENAGTLVYKVENRHRLGSAIAPQALGWETGYAGLTAVPFSDIGWALQNLFWSQRLLDGRVALLAGVVDVTDYVDVYGLMDPWTAFSNLAFTTNPAIPAPNQGLGAACLVMATDNLYLLGGIADANGDPTAPGDSFDSFFDRAEYFTHLEVGWISSWERRFSDNIHLTAWHADPREEAGTPGGWGLAVSFSRLFADKWEPFVRAGYAHEGGALWERSVSLGLGYHAPGGSDLLGLGFNWSRPSQDTQGAGLDDQYTAEFFYRFRLMKILTVTPGLQLLLDPALNPDQNLIGIVGIRGRISF